MRHQYYSVREKSDNLFFSRTDSAAIERRAGWINVGDLSSAVHFKIVKYERIKFLVIGQYLSDACRMRMN